MLIIKKAAYISGFLLLIVTFKVANCFDQKNGAPGNKDVISRIKTYLPANPVIVEAGTYDGEDTVELSKLLPNAKIYTLEPVPELFDKSAKAIKHCANVKLYNKALSDKTGKAIMHTSEERQRPGVVSMSSSLLAPKDHLTHAPDTLFKQKIEIETITLDDWAHQNQVDHIDFLKLDIQGYELNVIKASPELFKTVKAILLEVEFIEAYQGQYLYDDIKRWLEAEGFELNCLYVNSWFGDALFIRKNSNKSN
jgi:FkbM family methyltransferase